MLVRSPLETSCVQLFRTDLQCLSEMRKTVNNDSCSELNLAFVFTFTFTLKLINVYLCSKCYDSHFLIFFFFWDDFKMCSLHSVSKQQFFLKLF